MEIRRKVLGLHVLLLRIAMRLGQNPRSSIVQQVVYRCVRRGGCWFPNKQA